MKLIIADEVFRTVVLPATLERLLQCVNDVFWAARPHEPLNSKRFTCFYDDEEDERVVLHSETDFQGAVARAAASGKMLRIHVKVVDVPGKYHLTN